MNDSQLLKKKEKHQFLAWQKYSISIFLIFSIFTIIGILIARLTSNTTSVSSDQSKPKASIENHSTLDVKELKQTNETGDINQNNSKEGISTKVDTTYQIEKQYSEGKEKFNSAFKKLEKIDKVQDPQQGLNIVDQAINELEQSRELMLSISPESPAYLEAINYINFAEQYSETANGWKQAFIERSLFTKTNAEPFNDPNIVIKRQLPELSLKQKTKFLMAMNPRSVALTFDDGPTREYTPKILEILYKNNVQATFFVVGKRVRENCDVLRVIYQSGHEIGNHTDTHPYLTKISANAQAKEIHNVQESINQCLGFQYPMNWFRAPYGDQNPDVLDIAHRFGLNSIQWIVDTHDWKKTSSVSDIRNTINNYDNPGVILMHDGSLTNPNFLHPNENPSRKNTINALGPIISGLKNRGFNFVPLSKAFK